MKQKWGREEYVGDWPSDKAVWTIGAFFVALLSVGAICAYRYERVWTPLERHYLLTYAGTPTAGALRKDGWYTLLAVVMKKDSRLAIDRDVEPVTTAGGESTFALSDEAVKTGAVKLEWQRGKYDNAKLHELLAHWIYNDQSLTDLAKPALWGGLGVFVVGLMVAIPKDAARRRERKEGRRLKGPELVTVKEFNRRNRSDGIGFVQQERSLKQARHSVNRLGRFSSPDPLAGSATDPQSFDRYTYVRNNPISAVDPSGLDCEIVDAGDTQPCDQGGGIWGYGGGDLNGGDACRADGVPTSCAVVDRIVAMGAGVACPRNMCVFTLDDGILAQFLAFAHSAGYYPIMGPGAAYMSKDAAAVAFGRRYGELSEEGIAEYDINIYRDASGVYSYTVPAIFPCVVVDGAFSCISTIHPTDVPAGTIPSGSAHTHPDPSEGAYPDIIYNGDITGANRIFRDFPTINILYTVDPWSGRVLSYNPALYNPASISQCQAISIVLGSPNPSPCVP